MLGRPPYAQRSIQGVLRNPFAYPVGVAPGVDPNHPASRSIASGNGVSVIASSGGMVNILSGKAGTKNGSPTGSILGGIGPSVAFGSNTGSFTFANQSTAAGNITLAAIVQTGSSVAGTQVILGTSSSNAGHRLYTSAGNLSLVIAAVAAVGSGITLATNKAYFVASSHKAGVGPARFVVVDLATGKIQTASTAMANSPGANNGTFQVGNDFAAEWWQGSIAAGMYAPADLTATELLAWAQDPWSFWYPDPIRLDYVSAAVAVTGSLAATEAKDTAAIAGVLGYSGSLAATEAADTASIAGVLAYSGALAATEAADTATITGTVANPVTGSLAATESPDVAAITGTVPVQASTTVSGGGGSKWRDDSPSRSRGRSSAKVTTAVTDDELRDSYERAMGLKQPDDAPAVPKKVQRKIGKALKAHLIAGELVKGIAAPDLIDWTAVANDLSAVQALLEAVAFMQRDEDDAVLALLLAS